MFCNILLVTAVQHSESAICIHISPLLGTSLPFRPNPTPRGHHRALSWASWAIYQIYSLIIFSLQPCGQPCSSSHSCLDTRSQSADKLPKDEKCIYVNPNLPSHPTIPSPSTSIHPFSIYISFLALQMGSSVPFFYFPHIPSDFEALSAFPLCGHPGSSPVFSFLDIPGPCIFHRDILGFFWWRPSLPDQLYTYVSSTCLLEPQVLKQHFKSAIWPYFLLFFFSELQIIRIYCPSHL